MKNIEELVLDICFFSEKHAKRVEIAAEKLRKEMQFEINHSDYSEEYAKKEEQYIYAYDNLTVEEPYATYISVYTANMIYSYEGKKKDVFDFFKKHEKTKNYPNDFKCFFTKIGVDNNRWGQGAAGRFLGLGYNESGLQYNPNYIKKNKILFNKMTDLFPPFILNRAVFFCTINCPVRSTDSSIFS